MNFNKSKTISFTGHRDLRTEDIPSIKAELRKELLVLEVENLLVGNAKGADQLAREVALEIGIQIIDLDASLLRAANESDCSYYARQADYLIGQSSSLIAVWDGVYTGKPGGTSDIIERALAANKTMTIHHLVCPRIANPYPVASLLYKVIDFENKKFSRIPFAIKFSWIKHQTKEKFQRPPTFNFWENELAKSFIIPGSLVSLTLLLGFWGFCYIYPWDIANNFFRSVNLITFNNSVIEDEPVGLLLHTARFTGLMATLSTIFFALRAATQKQRQDFNRNKWAASSEKFDLVLGLNEKAYDLLRDLSLHHQRRLVVLYSEKDNSWLDAIKKLPNVIAVEGHLHSGRTLKTLYATSAQNVFIMSESDSENIRCIQELDLQVESKKDAPHRYVLIADEAKKLFLIKSMSPEGRSHTTVINVAENTARRLLFYYPIDRFYLNKATTAAHAIFIGFEETARQILLQLLKQGHYSRDKYLKINIYCKDAQNHLESFQEAYPQFKPEAFQNTTINEDVYAYTWANISLQFIDLPRSDKAWLDEQNALFSAVKPNSIVNLYATLTDSVASSAILTQLLPKIEILKEDFKSDVEVFCFYNFPDKKEERQIEKYLNSLAPHTFVKCFGNYVDECSFEAMKDISLDALPKLINAQYAQLNFEDSQAIDAAWQNCSEKDKNSNRQAADHIWSKIRLLWPEIDWKFNRKTFEPSDEVKERLYTDNFAHKYGEIEHRRWCAELLLQGFVPFDLKPGTQEYKEVVEKWKDKAYKDKQQIQKKHISLVPYGQLLTIDKNKDIDQIKTIPKFLRGVVET